MTPKHTNSPAPRVKNPRWLPFGVNGLALYPYIFILADRKDDRALLAHEMQHWSEQAAYGWRWVFTWGLRYLFSADFRFAAEVRGYRAQLAASEAWMREGLAISMSRTLAHEYRLTKSEDECHAEIAKE